MDYQLKIPVSSLFKKIHFSKKSIQILLSLSVFSFLISQSLQLHLFLSTFSSKLFSFSTERNYIFLLCNGVILVIIKTSGSSAPLGMEGSRNKDDERNNYDEAFRNKDNEKKIHDKALRDGEKNIHKCSNKLFTSTSVLLVETKTEVTKTIENENDVTREETEENVTLTAHHEVKDEDENDKLLKMVKEEEEQQIANIKEREEENEGLLSLEELNKKCEDFIRKMKQGIIIEDRQLIMV
ncbi:hypothetical protein POM88_005136 [Heracleum sosnowskyi]|uniref:Uncharacterized protein n=1 Tax=Heracleum sosnowskyi TaxID=360622 RepID=A0AAD8JL02_9APIA|nr:hypothetical protein POM88_005136 [Heracleum sosnowskyi]